jgi:N-acetylglucosamine-6-sulfatase
MGRGSHRKAYITDELTDYAEEWLSAKDDTKPFLSLLFPTRVFMLTFCRLIAMHLSTMKYLFQLLRPPYLSLLFLRIPPMWVRNQSNSRHGVEFAYYTGVDMKKYYRRYCEALLAVDDSVGRLLG